ncbi:Glycosyltransferase-like 1B [Apophysomyces sp. BC1034]|nr:Glycosyltransferase-like 1B [Apophysomyces sp. BC1015]KAG0178573.1 Glycosyltransferase-like 1B [Apophysomyces sp. BC1021]KAG0194745.1 Glycosyltransferase-like 1B [Apophysomyces sp. BC1034]
MFHDQKHIYSTRQHYGQYLPKRKQSSDRLTRTLGLIAVVMILVILRSFSSERPQQQLRDQPSYSSIHSCQAKLCNPAKRCSTWSPGHYERSQLEQKHLYRDVDSIDVDLGCQLLIKVYNSDSSSESWITVEGHMDYLTDKRCRNAVEMDLKSDLSILSSQLEKGLDDPVQMDREQIVTITNKELSRHTKAADVTLISQFSVNRLETFKNVIQAWDGPISVAVYFTDPDDISAMKAFFSNPNHAALYSRVQITVLKPSYGGSEHLRYPINHLRNLAILAASTTHIFVLDADFVPSKDLYRQARSQYLPFLESSNMHNAMVIPCYAMREVYKDMAMPTTVAALRDLVKRDIAYITDPGSGHGPTLAKEIALGRALKRGQFFYEACYESQWEPYYIVPRSAPLYDARFLNQGGDKQSHALQLNAEGYRFFVARDAFMIHKDHSKMVWPGGGFEKAQKEIKSWNYFEGFMREMEQLYGNNVRWPKSCHAMAIGWQEQRRGTVGLAAGTA